MGSLAAVVRRGSSAERFRPRNCPWGGFSAVRAGTRSLWTMQSGVAPMTTPTRAGRPPARRQERQRWEGRQRRPSQSGPFACESRSPHLRFLRAAFPTLPLPARVVARVAARPPLLRPEVAPEVLADTFEDVPELELPQPVLRDAAPAVNEPEQVARDGPRPSPASEPDPNRDARLVGCPYGLPDTATSTGEGGRPASPCQSRVLCSMALKRTQMGLGTPRRQ